MTYKEIYLAGKVDAEEVTIAQVAAELEARGHEVLEQWWNIGRLPKPYMDHPETSGPAAEAMIHAAFRSNVFVLFPGATILGAATELGAALASIEYVPGKEILIVNPYDTRQSVFYAHPAVVAVRSLAAIRQRSWY